MYMYKLN